MSVRLFVGNLSYEVTEADLRALFSEVGTVSMVRIPLDRESGRPRGFAFVDFAERAEGEAAISRFHQQMFKGRALGVSEAVAREDAPRAPARAPMSHPMGAPAARPAGPAGAPARTFGPDALPRNKRRPEGGRGGGGGERGPRGPIKESGAGRAFGGGFADDDADTGDEVPFWAKNDGQDADE